MSKIDWTKLKHFELFKSSPEDFIKSLMAIASLRDVPERDIILNQGEVNSRLMLLYTGQVEVLVNGEAVAVLAQPGDLMGEISVLTQSPTSASLVALTPVSYLEISTDDLNQELVSAQNNFASHFYRLLSSVLSRKIISTNEKARKFEITNQKLGELNASLDQKVKERTRELEQKSIELENTNAQLENQNNDLAISHRKLEELYLTRDLTFNILSELEQNLDAVREDLVNPQPFTQNRENPASSMTDHLNKSLQLLRPLRDIQLKRKSIQSQKVLFFDPDKKRQMLAKLAVGGTGAQFEVTSDLDSSKKRFINGDKVDLVFACSTQIEFIEFLSRFAPDVPIVLMVSQMTTQEMQSIARVSPVISTIISLNNQDRTFTIQSIVTTMTKLLSKDLFGLEKYLIGGPDRKTIEIKSSTERAEAIGSMSHMFSGLGVRSTIIERISLVAEELLMNAVYDAPTDRTGKHIYNHLPRTEMVELKSNEQAVFQFACDGMLAAISVADPFGSFKLQTLLNYLHRNQNREDGKAVETQEHGKGGAGKGLHLIIENSDLVIFNVKQGIRSEMIALFSLDPKVNSSDWRASFHFFKV